MSAAGRSDAAGTGHAGAARVYWQSPDQRTTLWLGDCREVMAGMAAGSVDVVITDPPYSEHTHAKSRRGSSLPDGTGAHRGGESSARGGAAISRARDLGFVALSPELRASVASEIARIVRRWALVFSDVEMTADWRTDLVAAGLDYVRTGAWVKVGAAPQFTGDRPATGFEAITIVHPAGRKRWNGGGTHAVWIVPIVLERGGSLAEERVHTTQKPIKLMRRLVSLFTDPDELVLDPFCGSGTTLAACHEQGRRSIGVELDEANCAAAAKRLDALCRQGALFGVGT